MFTIIFKTLRFISIRFGRTWRALLLFRLNSLYPGRIMLGDNFNVGQLWSIHFDASNSKVRIGKNFIARNMLCIRSGNNSDLIVGDNVFFNSNCAIHCMQRVIIGSDNQFGENVKIYDHNHQFRDTSKPISQQGYSYGDISIGNNCWIGSNVTILKGVDIGDNVIIGTGCVIHKSIASGTIVKNNQTLELSKYQD